MDQTKLTVRDLRRVNRSLVLREIYFDAPISRLEISRRSGLSPATVTLVVAELIEEGIVVESGSEDSAGGRPRTLTTINPAYGYFIGIDTSETHIHVVVFDLTMQPVAARKVSLHTTTTTADQVVSMIGEIVDGLLAENRIARRAVLGVGVGLPGVVNPDTGVSIFAPNWGWHNVNLAALLETRLGLPVRLDNGAKSMALAELWFGAGQGTDSLAVLVLGTGVGAGIIADGALYRGVTNSAGEWGHTVLELLGRPCRCGSRGCLEAYVGAPGIIARLRELAPASPLLHADQTATIAAIVAAARQGDPDAVAVLSTTTQYLAAGIANLINLVNPRTILVGGWLGLQLFDYIRPELEQTVRRYALAQPLSAVRLGACDLGREVFSLGAACLALEQFLAVAGRAKADPAAPEAGRARSVPARERSPIGSGVVSSVVSGVPA